MFRVDLRICFCSLQVCEEDESALDAIHHWHQGCFPPSLRPQQSDRKTLQDPLARGDDPDKPQETDADVVNRDVIEVRKCFILVLNRQTIFIVNVKPG